jgi:hypothetical protein
MSVAAKNIKRRLSAREFLMKYDTDRLEKYIDKLSKVLMSIQENFTKDIDEYAKKLPEEQQSDWYEWNSDKYSDLNTEFPRIHNNALFVSIYSYFEASINSLCNFFESVTDIRIKCKDLQGNGIDNYRKYLKLVHNVEFPDNTTEWSDVNRYRKIRNYIVHSNGKLDSTKKTDCIRQYVKKNPDLITIDDHDCLTILSPCNHIFVGIIRSSLAQIYSASKTAIGKIE